MKKLITAATALALAAGLASAQAPVVSDNIVGYQTETTDGAFRTLTVKFRQIGADTNDFDLASIIDGTTVVPYYDLLQVYDPYLGFLNYLWDGVSAWVDDVNFAPATFNVLPGNGFLMQATTSWMTMGEVASTNLYVHANALSTFNMLGNAFPAAQTLGNFDWSEVIPYYDLLQTYDPLLGFLNFVWNGTAWVDDLNFAPIPNSTPAEGFLFYSDTVASITQRLSPPYYVDE